MKQYTPIRLVCGDPQIDVRLQLNDKECNKEVMDAIGHFYRIGPKRVMVVMMDGNE